MLEPLSACLRLVAQALWRRINPFMQRLKSCDTDHIVSDRVAMQYAVCAAVCACVYLFSHVVKVVSDTTFSGIATTFDSFRRPGRVRRGAIPVNVEHCGTTRHVYDI